MGAKLHTHAARLLSCSLVLVGLASATGCRQDPAFMEQARGLTDEEIRERAPQDGADSEGKTQDSSGDEPTGTNNIKVVINNTNVIKDDADKESKIAPGTTPGGGGGGETGHNPDDEVVVVVPPAPTPTTPPGGGGSNPPDGGGGGSGNENIPKAGAVVTTEIQTKQAKADILWVVDNSGSMEWAQSQLASRFTAYANKLQDMQVDFQLGVTSTEMCNINWSNGDPAPDEFCPVGYDIVRGEKVNNVMVGPLRGELIGDSWTGKKFLLPGANFVSSFGRLAKMGVNGSSVEHGLTAAKFAIQKALGNGVNKGFLRNDAFLSVVVLSDEEDDGIQFSCEDAWGRTSLTAGGVKDATKCKAGGSSPYVDAFGMTPYAFTKKANGLAYTNYKFTADNFVSFLNDTTIKGPGKFRVSAITGMKKANGSIDCSFSGGPMEAGTNYIKAAQLTGGVAANICANDWTSVLADIGQNTAQLSSQIALPVGKIPFPGTLEVYVGGVKQAESKYVLNEAGNYVEFLNPLKAGTTVKVVYRETIF